MSRNTNDEILIRHYFLGDLSPKEQEQIEQRLMTEADCFQLASVVEEDLVDQYLYGNLSNEEKEKFAGRFLASPEGAEQLRFAANLKRHSQLKPALPGRQPVADAVGSGWFPRLRLPPAMARYALAATAILVAAILVVLGLRVGQLQNQLEQLRADQGSANLQDQALQNQLAGQLTRNEELARSLQQEQEERARLAQEVLRLSGSKNEPPPSLVATFLLMPGRTRSSGQSKPLVIKPEMSQVQLHLLAKEPAFTSYQASLQTESGKEIWTAASLKPQIEGDRIHVRLSPPVQLLLSGDYRLQLRGSTDQGDPEVAGTYYFRVDKK